MARSGREFREKSKWRKQRRDMERERFNPTSVVMPSRPYQAAYQPPVRGKRNVA